jgi:predicted AlkP superfamily phosphohydrolase/phosphomutase
MTKKQDLMDEFSRAIDLRMKKYDELDRLLAPTMAPVFDAKTGEQFIDQEEVDDIRMEFLKTGEMPRIPPELRDRARHLMLEAEALWKVQCELQDEMDALPSEAA